MINILYVHGNILKLGGTESYIMNYYRKIDKSRFHIDFAVHGFEKGVYDEEIIANGSKIYNLHVKNKNLIGNIIGLCSLIKNNNYDIIHCHMDAANFWPLLIAKLYGIPVRISHVHTTQYYSKNIIKKSIGIIMKKSLRLVATNYFACGEKAANWLYDGIDKKLVRIIPNAIDVHKFEYSEEISKRIRVEYCIDEDLFVVGHVGRFDNIKNQEFLLDIASRMQNEKICFMLLGDGEYFEDKKNELKRLGLKNVILVGSKNDINNYYNAFDLFVLPSRFEGFPVTIVEASSNGLDCIVSDRVSKEVNICNNVEFLPLDIDIWEKKLRERMLLKVRKDNGHCISTSGFNVYDEVRILEDIYLNEIQCTK